MLATPAEQEFALAYSAEVPDPLRVAATTIGKSVLDLGLEVRAGLHTGECEIVGEKLSGLAVNIGRRRSTARRTWRCSGRWRHDTGLVTSLLVGEGHRALGRSIGP